MISLFKRPPGPPDGRKYRMGLIFAVLMLFALFIVAGNAVLVELYAEFLTGLGLLYLTFCGGNVSNKWVLGKNGKLTANMGGSEDPPEGKV